MDTFRVLVKRIRQNIVDCAHTNSTEKTLLSRELGKAVRATTSIPDSPKRLRYISTRLRAVAKANNLYFCGHITPFVGRPPLIHTKHEGRFTGQIQRHLSTFMDFDTAETLTREVSLELAKSGPGPTFRNPIVTAVPLHDHGTPFWVANPLSGVPAADSDLAMYPARAGIAYEPGRYVVIYLSYRDGNMPRFPDSDGNPYWRPGGWTRPIDTVPDRFSGLEEVVLDGVRLGQVSGRLQSFARSV